MYKNKGQAACIIFEIKIFYLLLIPLISICIWYFHVVQGLPYSEAYFSPSGGSIIIVFAFLFMCAYNYYFFFMSFVGAVSPDIHVSRYRETIT
jgi:hypothetical protein